MLNEEDIVSDEYKYFWKPGSEESLQDFLAKSKPSLIRNDAINSKPWVWVHKEAHDDNAEERVAKRVAAVVEAQDLLKEVTKRISDIQSDDKIPIRSNKKKGLKSKKEVREEIQAEAATTFKSIAQKHGFVWGKWLTFVDTSHVDATFAKLAESLVSGPLSKTKAWLMKSSTMPAADPQGSYRHMIAIYFPDVYDEEIAKEIMKTLLKEHGLKLSGVKPDLYTLIGLDSKHPSGISSTVWKGSGAGLLKANEVEELRNEYFAKLGESGGGSGEGEGSPKRVTGKNAKTAEDHDPFASEMMMMKRSQSQRAKNGRNEKEARKRATSATADQEKQQKQQQRSF